MVTLLFFALLMLATAIALVDWRRGWLMALVIGVIQDPARKLTPGAPVALTYSIALVYIVILFAAQQPLQVALRDFIRRFGRLFTALMVLLLFLALAAVNGLFTYGLVYWKVPVLSLITYVIPLPAVLLGYAWVQREENLDRLFLFYAVITSIALIGTPLEYLKLQWTSLGMVGLPEGFIRHLPGLQIRILSGFYRAPDIMGWHAAMLTAVAITMALRTRVIRLAWPWALVAAWGFFCCLISGRRKAVYMVAVFAAVFLWRYFRRLNVGQVVAVVLLGVLLTVVVNKVSADKEANVYTKGTETTREEVLERLEGGLGETVRQFGIFGAGLGTATQGVRHFLGHDENIGWQEGGLGKLAIELGIPGLLAAILVALVTIRLSMKISSFPDEPSTSQLMRASLFAMFMTNVVEFMVSAQAYSDAMLVLFTAFLVGCLFATAALEDRQKAAAAAAAAALPERRGALVPAT